MGNFFKNIFGGRREIGDEVIIGIWDAFIDDLLAFNRNGDLLKGFNKLTFFTDDIRYRNCFSGEENVSGFKYHFKKRLQEEGISALGSLIDGVSRGWFTVLEKDCAPKEARVVANMSEYLSYVVGTRTNYTVCKLIEIAPDKDEEQRIVEILSSRKYNTTRFRIGRHTDEMSTRMNEIELPEDGWKDVSRELCTITDNRGVWTLTSNSIRTLIQVNKEPVSKDETVELPGDCILNFGHHRFRISIENDD